VGDITTRLPVSPWLLPPRDRIELRNENCSRERNILRSRGREMFSTWRKRYRWDDAMYSPTASVDRWKEKTTRHVAVSRSSWCVDCRRSSIYTFRKATYEYALIVLFNLCFLSSNASPFSLQSFVICLTATYTLRPSCRFLFVPLLLFYIFPLLLLTFVS
jgi:hypothetical protein